MRDPERTARTTAVYDALTCALANGVCVCVCVCVCECVSE
jgi:hypothetical protein